MADVNSSKAVWDALIADGYTEESAAGVMGNIQAESNFQCNNVQNNLGWDDDAYTEAVDNGSYSENSFVYDSIGYGLAQWTYSSRKQKLYNYTVAQGYSVSNESRQIQLLLDELESYGMSKDYTSIREASDWMLHDFENPSNQSSSVEEYRYNLSLNWYNEYTGSSPTPNLKFKKAKTAFAIKCRMWGVI